VSLYDNRLLTAAYTLFRQFFSNAASDWSNGYAYMALCCWDMQKYDEFMAYLQEAVDKNPKEARLVLGHLFPEGMKPEEYADYIKPKLNKK
jgi:tetratricopeptide (TPR) repeat protein